MQMLLPVCLLEDDARQGNVPKMWSPQNNLFHLNRQTCFSFRSNIFLNTITFLAVSCSASSTRRSSIKTLGRKVRLDLAENLFLIHKYTNTIHREVSEQDPVNSRLNCAENLCWQLHPSRMFLNNNLKVFFDQPGNVLHLESQSLLARVVRLKLDWLQSKVADVLEPEGGWSGSCFDMMAIEHACIEGVRLMRK